MRYVMKQKLFSWGDDFCIKDDQGRDVFFVDGRAFSIGEKLSFQDMAGNELAFISQKLLSWGPTYHVYRGSQLAAVVKKSLFTFFHCKFTVDVPGPDDLEAEGNFLDHEYSFSRGGSDRGERVQAVVLLDGHVRSRDRRWGGRCSHPGKHRGD